MLFTSARLNQTQTENQTAAQHPRAARAELEQISTFFESCLAESWHEKPLMSPDPKQNHTPVRTLETIR